MYCSDATSPIRRVNAHESPIGRAATEQSNAAIGRQGRKSGRYAADGEGNRSVRLPRANTHRFAMHRVEMYVVGMPRVEARGRSRFNLDDAAPSARRLSCLRPPAAARLAGASVPRPLAARWRGGRVGHEGRGRRVRFRQLWRRTVGEARPPVAQALGLARLLKKFGLGEVVLPSGRFADVDEPRQATLAQGKPFAHDFVEGTRRTRRHHATPHNTQLTKPKACTTRAAFLWRLCGGEKLSAAVAEKPQFAGCYF